MNLTRNVLIALFLTLPMPAFASDPPPADAPAPATASVTAVAVSVAPVFGTTRPTPLLALYAASIALNGYDAYSTTTALGQGGVEANPAMKLIVQSPMVFVAVKAAMTAATIVSAEQLWRRGRRGHAIALMIASNGLMAIVGAHNAAVLRGQR